MKNVYLVHIILPDVFTAAFYRLLPKQREFISTLMEERTVLTYSLDMDRKNVWAFIEADTHESLMELIGRFPIISYVKISVHELAYHDEAPVSLPDLIMN
jgi:muconolactone delta-isomerase